MSSNFKGIFWIIGSSIAASVMVSLVRYLSYDMHPFQIVFFRNFFALLLFLPWVYHSGTKVLKTSKLRLYFARLFIGLIAMYLWFSALSKVPLATATTLSFLAPLLAVILSILVLKEKSDLQKWLSLFLGFIGCIIVLRPGTEGFNAYSLLVIASTIFWAFSAITIKVLTKTDTSITISFYMVLMMTPLSLPLAVLYWQSVSMNQYLLLAALGLSSNIFQICLTKGYASGEMTVIQPFDFTRLIFISIIAYYIFGEVLDMWTAVGAAVIICSNIYATHHEVRRHRRRKAHDAAIL